MRKTLVVTVAATALITTAFIGYRTFSTTPTTTRSDEPKFKQRNKMPKQDRIDLAMEQEFELTKDPALNRVPRERLIAAESYRRMLIEKKAASRTTAAVAGLTWQERGPNNIGGRTRALLFDLNDAVNGYKKVWAGSVGGRTMVYKRYNTCFPCLE